jgi:PAS domain S-box-containing protein
MNKHQETAVDGSILIVDDSKTMALHLKAMLSQTGYDLYTAGTGKEAVNIAKQEYPHLILLDIMLPDMSGYEVCQKLKEDEETRDIPVVFVTGYTDVEERIKGLQLGAVDYITKPIERKILLTKAQTFVQLCSDSRSLKKMHARLLDSHTELKQFSQALDNASDSVVLTDREGNITYYNNSFEQLAGISPLSSFEMRIQSYFQEPAKINQASIRAQEGFSTTTETFLIKQNKTRVPINAKCSAILDQEGNSNGLLFLITDLTARKKAEVERKKLETELLHSQKLESVGQLASGIAHEINTPVQFIGDNIRFLQDSMKDLLDLQEKQKSLLEVATQSNIGTSITEAIEKALERADIEYLQEELPRAITQSLEGIERVAAIVRAMKEFAHPGTTEKAPANLNEAIVTTVTVARNKWKYVAELETDLDDNLPAVPCLVGEFNQVILNLIVNASDAISDRVGESGGMGKITISTHTTPHCAMIKIEDTGGGIPENIQDKIFDPFFTTKEVGRGSGQGLAIARNVIVNKHQGEFGFETEPGKGTTFIIRLPFEEVQQQQAGAA